MFFGTLGSIPWYKGRKMYAAVILYALIDPLDDHCPQQKYDS